MEQNKENERCNVYAQDLQRSSFAAHLRSNNHLVRTGEKV